MSPTQLPQGFRAYVANIGIKDDTSDFVVVAADAPCAASGLFTKSSFAGPSVVVSRNHVANHLAQTVVVISKNANVATGDQGMANTHEIVSAVASAVGCATQDVLIASTGVIGRQYPMDQVRMGLRSIPSMLTTNDAALVATAMMTTDTVMKIASANVDGSRATVVGVAKGVGMIEPDMATMITLLFTDAEVSCTDLDRIFRGVIDKTFNCVSIDTDTSTSDTAIILASAVAGEVDLGELERAIHAVALSLTKQVARDGEGAETLIEVVVDSAATPEQAKRVAKAIVNSPLVKTAVHGADPNWGRIAMAIGKVTTADEIDQQRVTIRFGGQEVYPTALGDHDLQRLAEYMSSDNVTIHVSLNVGTDEATVWGCDLTNGYIRINADYTT